VVTATSPPRHRLIRDVRAWCVISVQSAQLSWLAEVGVMTSDFAPIRISNDFSPQDGSSSITISRAEPVSGGNGAQLR